MTGRDLKLVEHAGFVVSTDRAALDVALIHKYLSEDSYWAKHIPLDIVLKSLDHSLCFGGYLDGQQVAFGRVVSDYATFAYMADVFVVKAHRGKGYSKALVSAMKAHPELQGLRRFFLATLDAHGLYAEFGFQPVLRPDRLMEITVTDVYTRETK